MNSTDKMRWKHQRLNNGCAWTCLAALLSRWGIDIETEQLVAESIIPYLIEYSTIDKSFRAGMLVQHTDVFNSITQPYGLDMSDYLRRSRESVTVFRNRMSSFNEEINSSANLSYEAFMERVYSLIKPITLDLRAAIETIDPKSECQRKLSDELLKLRILIQEHQSNYGSDNLPNLPEITDRICILLTEHIEKYPIL